MHANAGLILLCGTLVLCYSMNIEFVPLGAVKDAKTLVDQSLQMPTVVSLCLSRAQLWYEADMDIMFNETTEQWNAAEQRLLSTLTTREAFLNTPLDYHLAIDGYAMVASYNSIERNETIAGMMKLIRKLHKSQTKVRERFIVEKAIPLLLSRNVTFTELQQKIGEGILKKKLRLIHKIGRNVEEVEFEILAITQRQICFTPKLAPLQGVTDGTKVAPFLSAIFYREIKGAESKVVCKNIDLWNRTGPIESPADGLNRLFPFEFCAQPERPLNIRINVNYLESDVVSCRNKKWTRRNSSMDCEDECRIEFLRKKFHCSPLSFRENEHKGDFCRYDRWNPNPEFDEEDPCANECVGHCNGLIKKDGPVPASSTTKYYRNILIDIS